MDTRWVELCFLLILCSDFGSRTVRAASVMASHSPIPAIKGSNSQAVLRCGFSLDAGESLRDLTLRYAGADQATLDSTGIVTFSGNLIALRGYMQGSSDAGHLSFVLNDTLCAESGAQLKCTLRYLDNGEIAPTIDDTTTVQVEAPPLTPNPMTMDPQSVDVKEYSERTFTCSGNVGRPAGEFHWYTSISGDTGPSQDRTSEAQQGTTNLDTGDNSCTFKRTSTLTLNLTRTAQDQKLVVRCRVSQKHGGNDVSACADPASDFCQKSSEINIQYPVSTSVTKETENKVEGSSFSLDCQTPANPAPFLVEWARQEGNTTVTLTTGSTLTFNQVTLNQSGTYVCTAHNTIGNTNYSSSASVTLNVDETTTAPPTTSTQPTTEPTTNGDGDGEESTSKADSTTIIIVVVVAVVVVVVVVIVVVFIVMRRRRNKGKEVEEPPEKPFNNNAGINTVATRPDLVSNSYDHGPPFKNEDGLAYADLQFDNKPRSRRPLAIDDSTDYSSVSMPQV